MLVVCLSLFKNISDGRRQTGDDQQQTRSRYLFPHPGKASEYWPYFDVNGNGYLSLAEVDKGVRDVIQLPELFELKPVLIRAFTAARTKLKASTQYGDDYVSKAEFKYLIQYLRDYSNYWYVFNQIDTSKDRRVSMAEFEQATPLLQQRGLKIPNAQAIFCEIDTNNGGYILFNEFCYYVIENEMEFSEE